MCGRLKCCLRYELPNGKGVKHGGCADEGGCGSCDNPTGRGGCGSCGSGGCGSCGHWTACRMRRNGASSSPHRHHRRRSRRASVRRSRARRRRTRASLEVCEPIALRAAATSDCAVRSRACSRPRPAARPTTPSSRAVARCAARAASTPIATAPINKEAFALAGLPWRGHTDLLAHLTGAPRVAMMFYAEALRVVLATVHIAARRGAARADARRARGDRSR